MIIAAVIRHENQILLQQKSEINNQIIWELPNCKITDVDNQINLLVEKCKTLNVTIETTDIFFDNESNNQRCIVYNTELRSLSYSSSSGCWIDAKDLKNLSFSKQFDGAISKLVHEYDIINSIHREIEKVVIDGSEALGIKIELMTSYNYFNVFVHNDYGSYCPFIFSVDYEFESEDDIRAINSWHITRMFADGDKTDLYVLYANMMSILLKCTFHKNVYVNYLNLFGPLEINAASIIFNEIHKNLTVNDLKQVVEEIYSLYTFCMFLFENLIGSFSLIRDDAKFNLQYLKYFKDNECCNNFSREEHQYYSDCEKGISLLVIDNGIYHVQDLLKTHEFKFVDGIDGRILYQKNNVKESFNYISNEDWRRISQVITDMEIKDYTIVCQINQLYMIEQNGIWIFEGDFSEYWANIEKEKILDRQSFENKILHFNRLFKWRYPVNPGRFEELISDLLETEVMIQRVRLVGKSNNADGGRDLLIYKKYMQSEGKYGTALIIGQCKAYEKSVNKSHVRDIRDTLDYYNANGFFLAVTSGITTQLIDHLCKLQESRDVDWWTEREIFKKLRQNSYVVDRYLDILEVEN